MVARLPTLLGKPTDAELSDQLLSVVWRRGGKHWTTALVFSGALTLGLFTLVTYTFATGIGLWGNNIPVAWAFAIINFVWWIGIGHAGTFISAIMLLFEQKWRTSINRLAEAMTLFAVIQAGLFPILHLGRPWYGYWLFPYPATMDVWPQFKSALPWDAAAVSTYFLVSLMFWYLGLVPDFAALRDQAPTRRQRIIYGVLSLGWRGSGRHWSHYRLAYGLLGAIATPLVISVHSVVSSDFAIAQLPGWHSTLFPPLFVAGAIFSGFAMVATLMVPLRSLFKLQNVITEHHLNAVGKMLLVTGWIVIYSYMVEFFISWYSGERPEFYVAFIARPFGPNGLIFWIQMFCNVGVTQLYWFRYFRTHPIWLWVLSILTNVGMWTERFVIIVGSLQRDFLPSSWHHYEPTWVDIGIFVGTLGFFWFLYLLFVRYVPFIPVFEVKELNRELHKKGAH